MTDIIASSNVNNLPSKHASYRWRWVLLGLTILALALRCFAVNRHSFWYDEAVTASLVKRSYVDLASGNARDNGNPPLYWLLTKAWAQLFGRSDFALRGFSVLLGVSAAPLMAILGRRLIGDTEGLVATGLLAISPLAIELSNEARAYALLHLLALIATLLLLRCLQMRRQSDWVCYGGSVVLLCWTHYFGFFVPLAHGIAVAASAQWRKALVAWLLTMLAAGAVWSLWLPSFLQQLQQSGNTVRFAATWPIQFAATPVSFAVGRTLVWRDSARALQILAWVAVALVFAVPAIRQLCLARARQGDRLLGLWLLTPVVLPFLAALLGNPLYHVRAASVALPAFLLLVGSGWVQCSRALRVLLLAGALVMTCASLYRYAMLPLKDNWRAAVPAILADIDDNSLVVVDPSNEILSLLHYAKLEGKIPAKMVGVTSGLSENGRLQGVRYKRGIRTDRDIRDCTDELLSSSNICLVTCVPVGTFAQYNTVLSTNGYLLTHSENFHRIVLYSYLSSKE